MVRSAVELRQGIDARGDELWLDASARDALGFAVMARVRTERPMPSPAAPLTPPVVREANHAERNDAAAISEMMPEVYEDLRRLAETFLRGERTAHTLQRTALVHEAFLRLIGEKNLVWQNRSHFIGIFARVMRQTLTNYAVARHRLKRGGSDPLRLTLEFYDSRKIDVTALDQALQALEALDERQHHRAVADADQPADRQADFFEQRRRPAARVGRSSASGTGISTGRKSAHTRTVFACPKARGSIPAHPR